MSQREISKPTQDSREALSGDTSTAVVPLSVFLVRLAKLPKSRQVPLLWEDQRQRWRRGECPTVEMYLKDLPADVASEALLDLVYAEYVLRGEAGQTPRMEEYLSRFPDQASAIRRQLSLHEGLSDMNLPEGSTIDLPPGSVPTLPASGSYVPTEIAGYRVIAPLDAGGQGLVYRGVHPTLGRDVVIKVGRNIVRDGQADFLFQEGRILAELDHPGLARVFDLKLHEGRPCLVMEYIRGSHLEQDAGQRRRSPSEAANLIARLARALTVVHRRGVVHGDIKPRNILIDETGAPRLIDFGLARLEDAWRQPTDDSSLRGTVSYMAPEQARGEPLTPRSDIFALGAVLYFLLTGRAPYTGKEFAELRDKAERCDWNRQALDAGTIPPEFRRIVAKAMAADPQARYASAEEIAQDLEDAARPPRGHFVFMAAAAAVLLLVLGFVGWNAFQKDHTPVQPDPLPPPKIIATNKPDPRPFSMQVRAWRSKRYVELIHAVPITTGDEVRIDAKAPAAMHSALFLITSGGKVKLLASSLPATEDAPLSFPEKAQKAAPLTGSPGNELVLLVSRPSGAISVDDLRDLVKETATWPLLPFDSVLGISPEAVKVVQPSRDFGPITDRPDPEGEVRQGLEALQKRLAGRFDHFEGWAFSHKGE